MQRVRHEKRWTVRACIAVGWFLLMLFAAAVGAWLLAGVVGGA